MRPRCSCFSMLGSRGASHSFFSSSSLFAQHPLSLDIRIGFPCYTSFSLSRWKFQYLLSMKRRANHARGLAHLVRGPPKLARGAKLGAHLCTSCLVALNGRKSCPSSTGAFPLSPMGRSPGRAEKFTVVAGLGVRLCMFCCFGQVSEYIRRRMQSGTYSSACTQLSTSTRHGEQNKPSVLSASAFALEQGDQSLCRET